MSNKTKTLIQGIILTFLMVFLGLFSTLRFFSYNYPMSGVMYSYNEPSYYGLYNPKPYYVPYPKINAFRGSGAANYVGGYGPHGFSPFLMPSTCSSWYGCGNSYNSHIYINNALDYTYYMNPWLLEPRRMNNHQWYARGLWPQKFWY